jgi:hypothetical protein
MNISKLAALLGLCLLGLCFSGCASSGSEPTADRPPIAPTTSVPPPPLQTLVEGDVSFPCGPLWPEDEKITVRGLYRTSGDRAYLDIYRPQSEGPACWARFFVERDLGLGKVEWQNPRYLEVTGLLSAERWSSAGLWDLKVTDWVLLRFDLAEAQSACLDAVVAQSAALHDLDWAALAIAPYYTATIGFRPTVAERGQFQVKALGADDSRPFVYLTVEGPELPEYRPLVRRWVAVDCLYDLEKGQVKELVATIRGEVQE